MRIFVMLLALTLLFVSAVFAEDVLVSVKCPATAKAGTTNVSAAQAVITGNVCPGSVTFSRVVRGTVGNTAAGTLGALGLVGPIHQSFAAQTVACGATKTLNFYIPTSAGMVNTAATYFVQVLNASGQVIGSNTCTVPVVP